MALRVPIPNVSLVYLTFQAKRETSIDEIHGSMRQAAEGRLKGIIGYADEPLASADYNHNSFSAVYDATGTMVTGKRFCTVMAWYDNEWAFSLRMLRYWRGRGEARHEPTILASTLTPHSTQEILASPKERMR